MPTTLTGGVEQQQYAPGPVSLTGNATTSAGPGGAASGGNTYYQPFNYSQANTLNYTKVPTNFAAPQAPPAIGGITPLQGLDVKPPQRDPGIPPSLYQPVPTAQSVPAPYRPPSGAPLPPPGPRPGPPGLSMMANRTGVPAGPGNDLDLLSPAVLRGNPNDPRLMQSTNPVLRGNPNDPRLAQVTPMVAQAPPAASPTAPAVQGPPQVATPGTVTRDLTEAPPGYRMVSEKAWEEALADQAKLKQGGQPAAAQPKQQGGLTGMQKLGLMMSPTARKFHYEQQAAQAKARHDIALKAFEAGLDLNKQHDQQAHTDSLQERKYELEQKLATHKAEAEHALSAWQKCELGEKFLKLEVGSEERTKMLAQHPFLGPLANVRQDRETAYKIDKAQSDAASAFFDAAKKAVSLTPDFRKLSIEALDAELKHNEDLATSQARVQKEIAEGGKAESDARVAKETEAQRIYQAGLDSIAKYQAAVAHGPEEQRKAMQAMQSAGIAASTILMQNNLPKPMQSQLRGVIDTMVNMGAPSPTVQADNAPKSQRGQKAPPPPPTMPSMMGSVVSGVAANGMMQATPPPTMLTGGVSQQQGFQVPPPVQGQGNTMIPPPPAMAPSILPPGFLQAGMMQQPMQEQQLMPQQMMFRPPAGQPMPPPSSQQQSPQQDIEPPQPATLPDAAPPNPYLQMMYGAARDTIRTGLDWNEYQKFTPVGAVGAAIDFAKQWTPHVQNGWRAGVARANELREQDRKQWIHEQVKPWMTAQSRGLRNGAELTDPELIDYFAIKSNGDNHTYVSLASAAGWKPPMSIQGARKAQPVLPGFKPEPDTPVDSPFWNGQSIDRFGRDPVPAPPSDTALVHRERARPVPPPPMGAINIGAWDR